MYSKKIYLDYSATTPCDPEVLNEMIPYFTEEFGNAGSTTHFFGWNAHDAVELARERIAKSIGSAPKQIIFTSGATESNNIAIKGAMRYLSRNEGKNHLIVTVTEHKCVLQSATDLEEEGFEVTYLKVGHDGLIDINDLIASIKPNTGLISIAWVHNEIGVIQPIRNIGEICKANKILFHTDAAQALGRVDIDLQKEEIDLLSLSGHKIYGPKGVGALYIRKGARLNRVISGGGQERGLRSGTLPVPLCVGMGKAAEICVKVAEQERIRAEEFHQYMARTLLGALDQSCINGSLVHRVPHNFNISFSGIEGEGIMFHMPEIAFSSGSACTSSTLEPSYVISALGHKDESLVHSAIRIVFGRYTSMEDIVYTCDKIINTVRKLRSMSPLWLEN